jgi:hypothetical protein
LGLFFFGLGIKMAGRLLCTPYQQSGHISHLRFVCCRLGGRRGDTERVVARWRHLVAYMKALDLVHPLMNAILHRRTAMAIEMACDGGAFVHCHRLFCLA